MRPILLLLLVGCVNAHSGIQITTEDTTWIQKGITTRAEIIERFGYPTSEGPDMSNMTFRSTTNTLDVGTESETTTRIETTSELTRAVYVYAVTEGSVFSEMTSTTEQFWILYDGNGIVQDFGKGPTTGTTIR